MGGPAIKCAYSLGVRRASRLASSWPIGDTRGWGAAHSRARELVAAGKLEATRGRGEQRRSRAERVPLAAACGKSAAPGRAGTSAIACPSDE